MKNGFKFAEGARKHEDQKISDINDERIMQISSH